MSIHYISTRVTTREELMPTLIQGRCWTLLTAKTGKIMFLFQSSVLQMFLLGLCLGVEEGLLGKI